MIKMKGIDKTEIMVNMMDRVKSTNYQNISTKARILSMLSKQKDRRTSLERWMPIFIRAKRRKTKNCIKSMANGSSLKNKRDSENNF